MTYFDTYYYCNVIFNILKNQSEYMRTMYDLFEDENWLLFSYPFPKYSALHVFSEHCIRGIFMEKFFDSESSPQDQVLPITKTFEAYAVDHLSMQTYLNGRRPDIDSGHDYFTELSSIGDLDNLIQRMTDEIFYVMFNNRTAMQLLNDWIANFGGAGDFSRITPDHQERFTKSGFIKRSSIPRWASRAVYYRDRGRCTFCQRDVSGSLSMGSKINLDHIVPLAAGGINDVTNLQLLCEECNSSKSDKRLSTSNKYERWYSPS
ncbi:hypothetical protein Dcae01_00281 [Deinococcus caeni]|uniref:HNH nuclease domain-containing protein n=2 Tax=Deinococcus caeni TaxID=569127 RepID=A0ABP9U9B5_9DEIO